jgi:hypothetical protein
LLLLGAASYGIYSFLNRSRPAPFSNFVVTQVTNTGKTQQTAVSPDGRFLVSVQKDNGQESLWLRNIATASDTQVVPSRGQKFTSPAFRLTVITFIFVKRHLACPNFTSYFARRSWAASRRSLPEMLTAM